MEKAVVRLPARSSRFCVVRRRPRARQASESEAEKIQGLARGYSALSMSSSRCPGERSSFFPPLAKGGLGGVVPAQPSTSFRRQGESQDDVRAVRPHPPWPPLTKGGERRHAARRSHRRRDSSDSPPTSNRPPSDAPRLHGRTADPVAAEEARELRAHERYLSLLEKNPRRGTALDRVYGYHVERGSLDAFIKSYRTAWPRTPATAPAG